LLRCTKEGEKDVAKMKNEQARVDQILKISFVKLLQRKVWALTQEDTQRKRGALRFGFFLEAYFLFSCLT